MPAANLGRGDVEREVLILRCLYIEHRTDSGMARADFNACLCKTDLFDDVLKQASLGMCRTATQRGRRQIACRDSPLDSLTQI
ncbi:MAG: hypothetical protein ABJA20_06870 [Novosphingobium sp.]